MNAPTLDLENIQEKWMSALQLHTGIGDHDLGACNLALGMALGELETAWQRHYDALMISADELAHDNAQLLGKVQAITASAVESWRNGANGNGTHAPLDNWLPSKEQQVPHPVVIVEAAAEEADEGDDPLLLAVVEDDDQTIQYTWHGLPAHVLATIGDLELGKSWRKVPRATQRIILGAAIHEIQMAQCDGKKLSTRSFDQCKPIWMPKFSSLTMTLSMSWEEITALATSS